MQELANGLLAEISRLEAELGKESVLDGSHWHSYKIGRLYGMKDVLDTIKREYGIVPDAKFEYCGVARILVRK